MTGRLDEAIKALLVEALPALLGGAAPIVQSSITSDLFELDPNSADAAASEPRPDDRVDNLPFNPDQPAGPYTLTQPPDPGPRRVRLTSDLGDRIALTDGEVQLDAVDSRRFTLNLRPDRDLTGVNGVQVLYGVTAVYAKLKFGQDLAVQLQSNDAAKLEQAEALAVAVIALNRPQLIEQGREIFREGDYGAEMEVKSLHLIKGTTPAANTRLLHFRAEIELKATRALADDEGKPIQRIRTAARPLDARRAVDIRIDVEA
ncbi:MAG TPA: hypothetical protein VJZ26_14490 [Blastocatellia bacterium]|nr:hypothetical protein [Blastocatellia bacterium]